MSICDEIKKVLLQDWDPLGVGDNPKLSEEYDIYISKLFHLVENKENKEVILKALTDIENDLGVNSNLDLLKLVAGNIECISKGGSGNNKI
ncbi:MAG: hypothetical protein JXM68_00120 [Sedimentisphaerales bacterium]|nr:hypothetical protein [Sedimentisphaerales bacterium]